MAKIFNKAKKDADLKEQVGVSRREFFTAGAAAGVGAAVLSMPDEAQAQSAQETQWDYEADVVVCGGGASGLICAIRARDAGLSVLVVEGNFDAGGKMLHSGGQTSLGGGDPLQLRDIAGDSDPEGFITVPSSHSREELTDDVERLFTEWTDWSVLDASAHAPYRYNEREIQRAMADNSPATRQFMMDNYVRFARIRGSNPNSGISRARQAGPFLKLGAVTDIRAGTVSREDAGTRNVSASHFAPIPLNDTSDVAGPDTVGAGACMARCLEFSAREKGVQFMFNRHMDELIREQPFSGRVLGIRASYSPRHDPDTGSQLTSLWSNGSVDETRETITVRALKGVMIATGGHVGNPQFRSMFYPAMREPAFPASTWAVLGPRGQDASGIIAGMKVGATLAGMQQNLGIPITYHIPQRLATLDAYSGELPGHPTFSSRKSTGIALLGVNSFEHLIAVNQVGKRFFNEINLTKRVGLSWFPGGPSAGTPRPSLEHVPLDWRNSDPAWVRQMYARHEGVHAALAMNEGSTAPDFYSGPLWAIFDSAAVERDGWNINPPFTSLENGYFFRADTIEELAAMIEQRHEFQRVPLRHLVDTVEKWNAAAGAGTDPEFGRGEDAPMHAINRPPFYAASIMVVWHDSYGGLRTNGKSQVVDLTGEVIPGLYAGGEATGSGNQHGLARAHVTGFIAGTNLPQENGV
jgi:hypothetical protein